MPARLLLIVAVFTLAGCGEAGRPIKSAADAEQVLMRRANDMRDAVCGPSPTTKGWRCDARRRGDARRWTCDVSAREYTFDSQGSDYTYFCEPR